MKLLLDLFLTFLKIGLFTFGGGYAMLPFIENTCVDRKKWITPEEMVNITVIAESTPGPVAVNCATFIGLKKKGVLGAVFATLGVVLPSFVILLIISFFLDQFLEIRWVAGAFFGMKIAIGILITDAAVRMIKKLDKDPLSVVITAVSFVAMMLINIFSLRVSTIVLMVTASVVGLIVYFIRRSAKRRVSDGTP